MKDKSISLEIKKTDNLILRKIISMNKGVTELQISPSQIIFLKYLVEHKKDKMFQKDIEKNSPFRKSTISGIIQTMEKNGLIIRKNSSDSRCKEIVLTQKAIELNKIFTKKKNQLDTLATKNIDKDKLEIFYEVTKQIQDNLKGEDDV